MLLQFCSALWAVTVAVAGDKPAGLAPGPPIANVDIPRIDASNSVDSRSLFGLFERQSTPHVRSPQLTKL